MSGMPYMWQAGAGLQGLGNYNAPKTTMPQDWQASLTAPTGNYNANTLAGTDLSAYQNPYQQQVIDASMGDYQNLLAQGMNSIKANTPRCDTRARLPLWKKFGSAFAIKVIISAPHLMRATHGCAKVLNGVTQCANRQN
jgi:hypothetical protein